MSAPAHHTQTSDQQPSSTSKTKFVDNAQPAKEIGEKHVAIAGIGARAKADEHRRQVAERRRDKAERKRKRNQPVRNPWSAERKAAARARRAAKVAEAADLVCKPAAARANLGLPEPTREQLEIAWSDYLKYMRDWKIERGEITEEDDEPWVDNSKYNRARAADGFVGKSDDLACGKYPVGPFEEHGLRSEAELDSDPLFFAMATSTPKAGRRRSLPRGGDDRQRLRAGRTKDERPIMWGKLQALDNEYIDTLDSMWTWICIDLDQDFDPADVLREHIRAKVRPGRLACEPHHVVCALGENDELLHPHVWWKLPAGLEVYNDPTDKSCRNAPRRLYEGVATGICVELEDLGADAGHLGNPRGGKNPACPRLHSFVWNVDVFPTLEEWSRHVNIWHKRDHVVREQVMRAAGTPGSKSMSQEVFTQAVGEAYRMLHAANNASEAIDDLRERTEKLLADLRARFAGRDFGPKVTAADVDAVLRTVARYVAEDWAPWRTAPVANRGRAYPFVRDIRCRDENGKTIPEGVAKRQSMGGKVGPAIKLAKTLDMIVTAMEKLAAADRPLTLDDVTPLVDRDPRTVKNNWERAQLIYFSGSDPTEFSCLIGGEYQNGRNVEPLHYTDLRQRPAGTITDTAIHFWPGGHADLSPKATVECKATLDPCCPATEAVRHEPDQRPAKANSAPPDPPPADSAAIHRRPFAQAGDDQGVQRGIPAESGPQRHPGQAPAGRSHHAGGDRGRDVAGKRRPLEADPAGGGRPPEVARRPEQGDDLSQRRDQKADRERRKPTYATRRDPPLTFAETSVILFPSVGMLEHRDRQGASDDRESRPTHPPWLKRRTA